ncbi:polymorphic toxin-type HINT domain-containing protein [Micromonospora sp. NPDC049374]|uniref:polymorphic toxin-type HINT domain-containing protein n=1 Tax=Micromonospora sp. NPDC049374 TaxID=3154352 RepID=UPI003432B894
MADGSTKPIRDLRVGDEVLATNPETGESGKRRATHVWVHEDNLHNLTIEGGNLGTTDDHPFWNETDREWQAAHALDRGDRLTGPYGSAVVTAEISPSVWHALAYNLTVDDTHTYYVLAGNTPVLVHNTNEGCLVTQTLGAGPHAREGVGLVNGNIKDPGVIQLVDEAGNKYGCHTCGATTPKTKSGAWVRDHQPPTSIAGQGPQTAYPQCMDCMRKQGGMVRQLGEENYDFD